MKDNFSRQAPDYARFRPDYPEELFTFLLAHVEKKELAWDCGTGNGQVAAVLSGHFREVFATDISARQLEHASRRPNIRYAQEPAGACSLSDQCCQLVTVAQAAHWFDLQAFYAEVERVLQPGGVLALWGYGRFLCANARIQNAVDRFYTETVGPFWDPERRHIETAYADLPFPYPEWQAEPFAIRRSWTPAEVLAYVGTWSAVQHYRREKGADPMALLADALNDLPGDPVDLIFPVFLRAGRR